MAEHVERWIGARLGLTVALCLIVQCAAASPRQPAASAADAVTPPFVVGVFGDGFGEALADGLNLALATERRTTVLPVTHAPYGLSDSGNVDWAATIAAYLGSQALDAAVIMVGANDTAPLRNGKDVLEPHTPAWREAYGARVQAVAELFRAKGIPLTWVGLPIVRSKATSADFVGLNEIVRERATRAGATYVDSWDGFADEGGHYDAYGPDQNGQVTKLRTADGIDFTRAGAVKLAGFVLANLRRDRAGAVPAKAPGEVVIPNPADFDTALEIDITAQIRREAGLPALATAPSHPGKVTAGPVVPITAPVAPDGRLVAAGANPAPLAGAGGGTLAQRALTEGQPIQPRAGRSDDFAWPHP